MRSPVRPVRAPRAAALLALLLLPLTARGQEKELHWRELAVQARLDQDGRLHVREQQTMVFTGDWNGGARILRLDPGHPGNPQASGRSDRVVQQGGLAHARFSAQHERAALPSSRRVEQAAERRTFRETV